MSRKADTDAYARGLGGLLSRLFSTRATVIALGLGAGGAVALAGAGMGLGAVAGLGFFLLSLKNPKPAILASVAMMMVFGRDEVYSYHIPFAGGGLKPTDLLLAVTLAAWAVRVVVFRAAVLRLPPFFSCLVLAFLTVASFSAAWAISSGIYFKDALLELRPLLQYLLVFPLMAEFDAAALKRGVWVLLAVSVASSARILWDYFLGVGEVLLFGEGIRVVLLELGAYLPPVIIGLVYSMCGVRPGLTMSIGLLNLAALAVTFFRSAYLGLASGLLFVFALADGRLKRTMFKLGVFLLLAGAIASLAHGIWSPKAVNPIESVARRILSLGQYKDDISSVHRLREWEAAVELISKSPVWGNGLGTRVVFESPMYDPQEEKLGYLSRDIYMHNSYMWLLVKMGALGLVSFLAVWLTAMRTAVRALRSTDAPEEKALLLSLAGVLAGNMIISVFGPMFNIDNMTPINAFVLGSVFVMAREASNRWEMQS